MNMPEPVPKAREPKVVRDRDGLHKRRGTWHFKVKINGRWRERSTGTTNYRDAQRIRRDALKAMDEGRLPDDRAMARLEQVLPEYLEERRTLKAKKTAQVETYLAKPLLAALGYKRLCDINGGDIRQYQVARARIVSPSTVNREVRTLRAILHQHRLWGRLADDYKPLREASEGPGRALTDDEERSLFETAATRPEWRTAYLAGLLAANTGARGGELRGLQLHDVDLAAGVIRVRRANTKTDAGARQIPLNGTAAWAAARLVERAEALGSTEPNHHLFPAYRHYAYDPTSPQTTWRSAWRSLTRAAGLTGLRFHDLRHCAITKLAEAGVADATLMAIVGHVSREMLEHYSHVRQQAKRQAVELIDSYQPPEMLTGDTASTVQ